MTRSPDATVLLVDDDDVWRAALASWVEREGYRVLGLSRGDRVASTIDCQHVDIVILDLHMPGLDGLDVLAEVRQRWPHLPVIVMTAFGGPRTLDVARQRGATGYLEKPFHLTDLLGQLHRVRTPGEGRRGSCR